MDLKKDFSTAKSQTVLSMTQLWVCWTPRDPSLKQRMKKQWFYGLFLQQVAKYVSDVRNLLFSQAPTLQVDTDKQW